MWLGFLWDRVGRSPRQGKGEIHSALLEYYEKQLQCPSTLIQYQYSSAYGTSALAIPGMCRLSSHREILTMWGKINHKKNLD